MNKSPEKKAKDIENRSRECAYNSREREKKRKIGREKKLRLDEQNSFGQMSHRLNK